MTAKWSTKSIEQIENILKTNAALGLSRKAARMRQKKGGENLLYKAESSSLKNYVFHLLGDLTSYLLIIAAIVAFAFDYEKLAVVIFVTWAVNVSLALFTYMKAEKIFDNASFYSMPKTRVLREGKVYITDINYVVRGDVVLLREGDIAPCDLRLVSSKDLVALEYDAEKKQKMRRKDAMAKIYDENCEPEAEQNMVFAGAVIAKGEARAIAVDISEDTYTYEIMGELELSTPQKVTVFEKLGKYCTIWSISMLVLMLPLSLLGIKTGIFDSFMLGLALASSTMSEMLVAVGRIIVACSVINTALIGDPEKNTAIIKNISKIDKMPKVDALLILEDSVFTSGKTEICENLFEDEKELFAAALMASGIGFENTELAREPIEVSSDNTALTEYAEKLGVTSKYISERYSFVGYTSASEYNFDTALVKDGSCFTAYIKGDAKKLLHRCSKAFWNNEICDMTSDIFSRVASFINEQEAKNRRTYIIAKKISEYNNLQRISTVQTELTYLGVISIADPVMPSAKEKLISLRNQGIKIVFAAKTDNAELKQLLSKDGLADKIYYTDDIAQKRNIFEELKKNGNVVAAVGSGVSDIAILKRADVSFTCNHVDFSRDQKSSAFELVSAENEYGTQIAKKEADVIIKRTEGQKYGIASIASALDFARAVCQNIENMSKYLVSMLSLRLFVVLIASLFNIDVITPSQILFSGLVVDFFAVLIFAFEKPDALQNEKKSAAVLDGALKKNIFWILLGTASALMISVVAFAMNNIGAAFCDEDILACSFVALILSQLIILLECTSERFLFSRKIRLNVISIISVCVVFASILIFVFFPEIGTYMDICVEIYQSLLFSLIVPVFVLVVSEIKKLVCAKRAG